VLALWGVVISAVYMLRAYRRTFMGTLAERFQSSKDLVDLRRALRVPVTLLVGGLIYYGFFPQSLVRIVTPVLRIHLAAKRNHLINMQTCSHGAVRRLRAVVPDDGKAPQGRGYNELAWR